MSDHNIDVAAILEALRAEVHARRPARADAADSGLSALERELQRCVEQLEITRVVSAHWPLEGRGIVQRAWFAVHKVVRRYLRWYINPIVEQQNAFNDVAARTLRLLVEAQADLRRQAAGGSQQETGGSQQPGDDGPPSPVASGQSPVASTEALQALVEVRGAAEPPAALPDVALRSLTVRLCERQRVIAHWRLEGDTPLTQATALLQRAIRQYLRWYINPIVEQQNAFNAAMAEAAQLSLAADAATRTELARLRHEQASRAMSKS